MAKDERMLSEGELADAWALVAARLSEPRRAGRLRINGHIAALAERIAALEEVVESWEALTLAEHQTCDGPKISRAGARLRRAKIDLAALDRKGDGRG